ncbi:hypothetical protein [Alkalicoccobacillus plakortidis]|uniref:Uncharacterized protein n=1 Tax=Alkalicoccobacillus plakortidis TaxID=444060 RepID=A0ABT0XGS2_9BACI|nr:hypothetical protein [Alkalicoccobacillus plakortidis]MCM2675111.1 hypothetical protein [Alkalicoccobacillus plakortidis]
MDPIFETYWNGSTKKTPERFTAEHYHSADEEEAAWTSFREAVQKAATDQNSKK